MLCCQRNVKGRVVLLCMIESYSSLKCKSDSVLRHRCSSIDRGKNKFQIIQS
jgi:hypothetical protein